MGIQIKLYKEPGADPIEREVCEGTVIEDLINEYRSHMPYRIMTARVDGSDVPLTYSITKNCSVIFCDIRDNTANRAFQRGVTMLFLKAVHELYGRGAQAVIQNAVNRGIYTTIEFVGPGNKDRKITGDDLLLIEKHMWKIADANIEIRSLGENVYKIGRYTNTFYGLMPPRTGYLCPFALEILHDGVLLRFAHPSDPGRLSVYRRDAKIFTAYEEEQAFLNALHLSYIEELNKQIENGAAPDIIRIAEYRHSKRIDEIAEEIIKADKRCVLIAGPSSSGKTTLSNRLIEAISKKGVPKPLYLGTDDYFIDREFAPRDRKGEFNFEGLDAMDLGLFNRNIEELLEGKRADLPRYDFIDGVKKFGERKCKLEKNQIIVVEGIHALNKKMTTGIEDGVKFRVYISPLTQLNIDDHNRVPSTDVRIIRRMIRDHRTRGHSVANTIRLWPKVRAGESVNIFPYNNEADEIFNSTLVYELPVMRNIILPLLDEIKQGDAEYGYAEWIRLFVSMFTPIEKTDTIPPESILREFIG